MSRFTYSLFLSTLLLAGCKTQVNSDIYLTDVALVASSGKAMPFDLKLSFEVPSPDKCAEANTMLTPTLDKYFGDISFTGCNTEGFSSFATFTAGSEMVHELANKKSDSKMPIYLGAYVNDKGGVEVGYFASPESLKGFTADLPDQAKAYSNKVYVTFAAAIHNDGPTSSKLSVANVFVNGSASLLPRDIDLDRRKDIIIQLSDVANATVSAGMWATIFTVLPSPAP